MTKEKVCCNRSSAATCSSAVGFITSRCRVVLEFFQMTSMTHDKAHDGSRLCQCDSVGEINQSEVAHWIGVYVTNSF